MIHHSDRSHRAEELAAGHEEQKGYARLAHSELRGKGIQQFVDDAGREYRVSEQKLQIILPDGPQVHYSADTDSIIIMGAEGEQTVGYTDYVGDFTPFVEAVGRAQTIALSEDPRAFGTIVSSVSSGQGETAAGVGELVDL